MSTSSLDPEKVDTKLPAIYDLHAVAMTGCMFFQSKDDFHMLCRGMPPRLPSMCRLLPRCRRMERQK